jgi:hypothetical protein
MSLSVQDQFIERVVAGSSFVDIGALWGTVSEKASTAWSAGASDVSVVDILPQGHELWSALDAHLSAIGSPAARHVTANLDAMDPTGIEWDVVHTSGVIYHCPNPVHTLCQLRAITNKWLIITSMVIPQHISSPTGSLELRPGQSYFVPTLDPEARTIAAEYLNATGVFRATGVDVPVAQWDTGDYGPWWWLFTPSSLAGLLSTCGFEVVDDGPSWEGRSHTMLARPV